MTNVTLSPIQRHIGLFRKRNLYKTLILGTPRIILANKKYNREEILAVKFGLYFVSQMGYL